MKKYVYAILSVLVLISFSCTREFNLRKSEKHAQFGLVIHGGAGNILKSNFTPIQEAEYIAKLSEAIDSGYAVLENGGTSLDAVEVVVRTLEDSPLFNAGKGSVYNSEGKNELDASIMDGSTLMAGAVAGLTHIKNPITLARLVMQKSEHVMMIGNGAEQFAREMNVEFVDSSYFFTEKSWNSYLKAKEADESNKKKEKDAKMGTVGCVALDKYGNLAAGTSTGGRTYKKYGRVGDVPVIGAGTYANNKTCAISCTGHGEFFIRNVVAHSISDLMDYRRLSLMEAANRIVHGTLKQQGGEGGVIGIDKDGNIIMSFNSSGMFRGYKLDKGEKVIKIYED